MNCLSAVPVLVWTCFLVSVSFPFLFFVRLQRHKQQNQARAENSDGLCPSRLTGAGRQRMARGGSHVCLTHGLLLYYYYILLLYIILLYIAPSNELLPSDGLCRLLKFSSSRPGSGSDCIRLTFFVFRPAFIPEMQSAGYKGQPRNYRGLPQKYCGLPRNFGGLPRNCRGLSRKYWDLAAMQ